MNLEGKRINFLGDSITEGYCVLDIDNNRYDNIIKNKCGLFAVYNFGIGGTRIAHQKKVSENPRHDLFFCGRASQLNPDADMIVVFGGTNDYGHGDAPFGEPSDTTPDSFYGAVEWLMTFLKEQYPNQKVVFMTPARRCGDELKSNHLNKLSDAKPLRSYVDVIIEKGKAHDIPVLDLYKDLKIDLNKQEDRTAFSPDGLHFNDAGQEKIAELLIDFLENL